jgi:PAS domain S-box-containing protein
LHALVETSRAAIVTVDQHGIVKLANRAAVELVDPPGAVLLGEPIAAFLPELQNALPTDGRAQFRTSMECHLRRTNGEHLLAEVWFSTFNEQGNLKLAAIIADVSEEQRADDTNGAVRHTLNNRQLAVLRLVFEGLRNTEIEARLQMTPSAVKNTLHQLFSKAEAKNRSQLVRVALERYRDLL